LKLEFESSLKISANGQSFAFVWEFGKRSARNCR